MTEKDRPTDQGGWPEASLSEDTRKLASGLAADGPAYLVELVGPNVGRKYSVQGTTTLGRSLEATICLNQPRMSRLHCRIAREADGTYSIEDLGSKNGTLVNGERIARRELRFGDEIHLGAAAFLFTHHNPLDAQLAQKSKMELLGRLGAGIAHDFNNLLGVMVATEGFLDALPKSRVLGDPEVEECRADIKAALERAAGLTSRLLGVVRQGDHTFGRLSLNTICEEVVELIRRTSPTAMRIDTAIQPGLRVVGDRDQLHQMLLNLCINARDAMVEGGRLEMDVQRVEAADIPSVPWLRGACVKISVSDTGVGMDSETRRRAFDPFFTTKPRGVGTGLGLATVAETVKYHGGHVVVESEPGRGTTFHVYLPAAPAQRPAETLDGRGTFNLADLAVTRARVLLVDDDEAIRRSLGRLLKSLGYDVMYAVDGEDAVSVYIERRPDVVMLDLDMPVLSGRKAFRKLADFDPGARVVFMSGHWDERYEHEGGGGRPGPAGFLEKPCGPEEIQRAIQRALQSRTALPRITPPS